MNLIKMLVLEVCANGGGGGRCRDRVCRNKSNNAPPHQLCKDRNASNVMFVIVFDEFCGCMGYGV